MAPTHSSGPASASDGNFTYYDDLQPYFLLNTTSGNFEWKDEFYTFVLEQVTSEYQAATLCAMVSDEANLAFLPDLETFNVIRYVLLTMVDVWGTDYSVFIGGFTNVPHGSYLDFEQYERTHKEGMFKCMFKN